MFMASVRNRRRFQPVLDGLPLRIAPTVYMPPAPSPVIMDSTPPTSNDTPPPPPSSSVYDSTPPCSVD